VLTGGTSLLEGLVEYAEARLSIPARLGAPDQVKGLADSVRMPSYSTGVGLTVHGARGRGGRSGVARRNGTTSLWDRTRNWVRDLLQGP
jgi:cell division protein FtsA